MDSNLIQIEIIEPIGDTSGDEAKLLQHQTNALANHELTSLCGGKPSNFECSDRLTAAAYNDTPSFK